MALPNLNNQRSKHGRDDPTMFTEEQLQWQTFL